MTGSDVNRGDANPHLFWYRNAKNVGTCIPQHDFYERTSPGEGSLRSTYVHMHRRRRQMAAWYRFRNEDRDMAVHCHTLNKLERASKQLYDGSLTDIEGRKSSSNIDGPGQVWL